MADTAKNVPRITAEEYFKLTADREDRTELLDGEIVAMASPSIRHQDIASGLITELRQFVKRNGGKCRPFAAPTDVRLDDLNVLVPDVFVSCDPERFGEQYHSGAPDFVVEIVSTNRSDDFSRKLWLYRRSGVREYWIVDPKKEQVTVWFFEDEGSPYFYKFDEEITVRMTEGSEPLTINIKALLAPDNT